MNTENIKTGKTHIFKLGLTDKLNLKDPKKNMALANLIIFLTLKNIESKYKNNKFKFQLQFGMTFLIYLMVLILLWISKITLNLSSKNMKLSLEIPKFKFM